MGTPGAATALVAADGTLLCGGGMTAPALGVG
jgi:hypothetical protein